MEVCCAFWDGQEQSKSGPKTERYISLFAKKLILSIFNSPEMIIIPYIIGHYVDFFFENANGEI